MANGINHGEGFLNKLCQEGKLKEVQDYINRLDEETLGAKLSFRAGPLQYTPLHEAAANGHTSLVDLLVACGADINCRSKGGHTPLHVTAKGGHSDAALILLSYKADLSLTDGFGKTAKQLAEANSKDSVVRVLHSEEIVREAEAGCELIAAEENENRRATGNKKLIQLLHSCPDDLEADYPYTNQAIIVAVLSDNHMNVGVLANFSANLAKVDNALHFARNLGKHKSHAALLLIKAVLLRDKQALEVLFGEHDKPPKGRANTAPTRVAPSSPLPRSQSESSYGTSHTSSQEWSFLTASLVSTNPTMDTLQDEENLAPVITALVSKQVSAAIALPAAISSNDLSIVGELLWRVGVDPKQLKVSWFDLGLTTLSQEWLYRVHWVQTLNLACNKLRHLPDDVHVFLTKVVHLDLQHNDLTAVPPCVLTLPSLKKLNLSHNNLTSFPEVPKWSSCLLTLLLSHNTLTSIPGRPSAFSISELDLSDNKFSEVPPCVPHMRTLKTLDLRGNPITTLPPAMARLKSLTGLYLEGLRIRNVPRHAPLGEAQHCIQSISSRQPDLRPFHNMRICVLGTPKTGKSSLVAHLLGREPSQTPPTSLDVCELEVKSFGKKPLQFSVWDFSGGEALHGMHQCYLSKRTMCMVLFNLKHGTEGIEEVKFWLDSIVSRSLEVCVVVVGTHLDLVADKERSSINKLLQEVTRLGTQYAGKVALKHVVAVGLKNRIENIAAVKSAIYRCAVEHHVNGWSLMGVDVPVSYHLLHRHLSRIQRGAEHRYTMTKAEFRSIYQQLKASDFEEGGEEELSGALLFLMDMGCLAHYDSPFYNLWDLYWVDVPWLYSTLAKVSCGISHDAAVTVAEEGSLESCIVSTESIAPLLQCVQFPRQHYNQLVALLSLLKVAFPLNSHQMFVPRLLPEAMLERRDDEYFRCIRYIAFKGREPVGFWNQLLYQIVWFVPQVRLLFDKFFSREHRRAPELLLPTLPLPELVVQPRDGPPLDPTDAHLHMWQCGVFYEDSDVTFRVQSITQHAAYQVESLSLPKLMKEGVSIACTCNDFGKRMFTQLVDLVHGLLDQWDSDSRAQTVTCPECINKVPQWPFEFSMDQCLAAAATGQQSIECTHDRHKTHTVSLGNLVPELLLLHKLPGAFQSAAELVVQGRLLTMGKDVQTYQGHFRGKPVAIKCFSEPLDVRRLSKEVTLLRSISHPNIVTYAGISVPMRMILTEGTPIGTLHALLYEDNVPIPRLVVHRMAFQVSSAIQYLHRRGIVLRDLKAEGVFVWSLSPRAPTHCTLANLEHHALCSNVGCTAIKSSSSVPGVSAPEVIRGATSFSRAYERCDTSIDIFSFAMLFYQVASRRHPYHHLPSEEAVEVALETGERPELRNLPSSGAAFFYLFKLLQWCWHGDPHSRPSADHIVDVTVRTIVHSVMAVVPIPGSQSLRCACVTPPTSPHGSHELWVCSESALGTGVNVYDLDTMTKVSSTFLHSFQVLGINACSKCVWISQRAGSNTSIYSTRYREPLAKVPTEFLSCMTCLESRIYCGTAEGQCLAFSTDSGYVSPVSSPDVSCSLEKAVLAMAVCQGLLWVSVQHQLYFLDLETLATVGSAPWHEDIVLSQLSVSDDGTTVWGAHLLGVTLSAWDAQAKIHMYSIDTREQMRDIAPGVSDSDVMITASVPVLDTVWVGMATGHILQFHRKELLAWFQPYNDYIRLLVRAPCTGSDQACEARVISGGKLLRTPLVGSFKEYEPVDVVGEAMDSAGILVMWEAFPAEVIKQIRSLEEDHVERIKGKALEGKGSISSLGGKVPTPQIKIEDEPSVSARPDSDIYDIPCESSLPGFLGDTTNLAGRPLPDRVVSSLSIDSPTPITDSDCDSLYEYLESPLLPLASDRQPVSQSLDVPDRSFLEDTLAVSPLANVTLHHHESRERAISSTDTLYDYPVFPLSSSVSPELAALTSQTMKPLPPMWASEICPIPSSDHPLLAADLTTELPGNDDGCGPIQQCPQGRVSTR